MDQACEFARDGQEEGFVGLGECTVVRLPYCENAQHSSVTNDRHAKEGVVCLLSVLGKIAKSRMLLRIRSAQRLSRFDNYADQAFAMPELDPTDCLGIQSIGRHQDTARAGRVDQIDGAHVDGQTFLDPMDDNIERAVQTCRTVKL